MPECVMVQIVNGDEMPLVEVIDVDGGCCLKMYPPDHLKNKVPCLLVMLGEEAGTAVGKALIRLST